MKREHTLSILVRNKPGVLTKIAGMFYRRDYNIQSITDTVTPGNTQHAVQRRGSKGHPPLRFKGTPTVKNGAI